MKNIILLLFLLSSFVYAQDEIKSIKIGNQTWMTENLNVDRFKNGDIIPEYKSCREFELETLGKQPACCIVYFRADNGEKYGRLYNWYAVNDKRGLAPEGWHIPSKSDFEKLLTSVNNDAKALKAPSKQRGTQQKTITFNALLLGYVGLFCINGFETEAYFWTSTEEANTTAWHLSIDDVESTVGIYIEHKRYLESVRCIKD